MRSNERKFSDGRAANPPPSSISSHTPVAATPQFDVNGKVIQPMPGAISRPSNVSNRSGGSFYATRDGSITLTPDGRVIARGTNGGVTAARSSNVVSSAPTTVQPNPIRPPQSAASSTQSALPVYTVADPNGGAPRQVVCLDGKQFMLVKNVKRQNPTAAGRDIFLVPLRQPIRTIRPAASASGAITPRPPTLIVRAPARPPPTPPPIVSSSFMVPSPVNVTVPRTYPPAHTRMVSLLKNNQTDGRTDKPADELTAAAELPIENPAKKRPQTDQTSVRATNGVTAEEKTAMETKNEALENGEQIQKEAFEADTSEKALNAVTEEEANLPNEKLEAMETDPSDKKPPETEARVIVETVSRPPGTIVDTEGMHQMVWEDEGRLEFQVLTD